MPEPTTRVCDAKPHQGWVLVNDDLGLPIAGRIGQIVSCRLERWPGGETWAYAVRFPGNRVFSLYHCELSKWTVA